jgi:hypothetical protein
VAVATLAWTIYNDQRKHTSEPPPSSIARQVRITLRERRPPCPPGLSASPKWLPPRSPARPPHPSNRPVSRGTGLEHPGFGGDSILPRCSPSGWRCLPGVPVVLGKFWSDIPDLR